MPLPFDRRLFFLLDGDGESDGSGWTDDIESCSKSENEMTPEYPISGSIGNRDGPALGASGLGVYEEKGEDRLIGAADVAKVSGAMEATGAGVARAIGIVAEATAAESGIAVETERAEEARVGPAGPATEAIAVETDAWVEAMVAATTGMVVEADCSGEREAGVAHAIGMVETEMRAVCAVTASGMLMGVAISDMVKSTTVGLSTR